MLVKDLIKITVFDIIVFFQEILILTLGKFFFGTSLIDAVIASAELY